MTSSLPPIGVHPPTDDVLAQLPAGNAAQYRKGERIYGPDQGSSNIYRVVSGTVRVSHVTEDGREVLRGLPEKAVQQRSVPMGGAAR